MLTTSELYNSVRLPTCTYSIRELTSTGSLIRYAKVGDKLVHVWECDDGMMVQAIVPPFKLLFIFLYIQINMDYLFTVVVSTTGVAPILIWWMQTGT